MSNASSSSRIPIDPEAPSATVPVVQDKEDNKEGEGGDHNTINFPIGLTLDTNTGRNTWNEISGDDEEGKLTAPSSPAYYHSTTPSTNDEVYSTVTGNKSRQSIDPPSNENVSQLIRRRRNGGSRGGYHDDDIFIPPLLEDYEDQLHLEKDTYTLLLVTTSYGIAFWFAVLICIMQVGLLFSILEQMLSKSGPNSTGTFLNIPFATTKSVQSGQFIAILFSLLTQRDLLQTVPLLIALWDTGGNWKKLNTTPDGPKRKLRSSDRVFWWEKIFVTYFLRLGVSLLALFTAFILIIQSTDIIDLVKDFTGKCSLFIFHFIHIFIILNVDLILKKTALYIVSELDNYAFMAIKDGYFGHVFSNEIRRIKETKIVKEEDNTISCCNKNVPTQSIAMLVLFSVMVGSWLSFLVKQNSGLVFKEKWKNCTVIDNVNNNLNYLSWGDGTCDPKLFTDDCGLDGGDCDEDCTTYFQFSPHGPYRLWGINNKPIVQRDVNGQRIWYSDAEIFYRTYDVFWIDFKNQLNEQEGGCEIKSWGDFNSCESISPLCKQIVTIDSKRNDIFDVCFNETTIYKSKDNLWYCWYGIDSITLPQDTRDQTQITKSQRLGRIVKSQHLEKIIHVKPQIMNITGGM